MSRVRFLGRSVVAMAVLCLALVQAALADAPSMPDLGLDDAGGTLLTTMGTLVTALVPYLILIAAIGISLRFAFGWFRKATGR